MSRLTVLACALLLASPAIGDSGTDDDVIIADGQGMCWGPGSPPWGELCNVTLHQVEEDWWTMQASPRFVFSLETIPDPVVTVGEDGTSWQVWISMQHIQPCGEGEESVVEVCDSEGRCAPICLRNGGIVVTVPVASVRTKGGGDE